MPLDKEHIDGMKPGSVVVDLAAETGGNVETTKLLVPAQNLRGRKLFSEGRHVKGFCAYVCVKTFAA